jgi:hypothetical protein
MEVEIPGCHPLVTLAELGYQEVALPAELPGTIPAVEPGRRGQSMAWHDP